MNISLNKKHKIIAFYDVHCPHEIRFDPVLKFQKSFDPTFTILGGDFMNCEWASHWNESLFGEIGFGKLRKLLKEEMTAGKRLIERIKDACPNTKLIYIPGNHEHTLFWAAQAYPDLGIETHLDMDKITFKTDLAMAGNESIAHILEDALDAKQFDMTVLPYNEPLQINNQMFLHGHQLSISNSPKLYPNKNVIWGHYHTEHTITLNDNGDGDVVQHRAVPCLTHLGPSKPGYLGSKSTRWLNGFWVSEVEANGYFEGRIKKVLGGKLMIGS